MTAPTPADAVSYSIALYLAEQGWVHPSLYASLAKIAVTHPAQLVWARRRVEFFETVALQWAREEVLYADGTLVRPASLNPTAPAPAHS